MKSCFADAARFIPGGIPPSVLRCIRYSGRNLSVGEIGKLYRASDCYVSAYRAEGFNLPVLEALASGVTPIVTAGGSTDDFCPDHLSLKVSSTLTPTPASINDGGRYLEPGFESLVDCLRRAVQDDALRGRVAAEGPRWVAERFTWAQVSRALADRLAA
jgi:glycosyltransferase involved in cell wall biosynthesis